MSLQPRRVQGSAARRGASRDAWARDWAEVQEPAFRPLYETVLRATGIEAGASVLDVGCGAGLFCALAAACGARVSGVDTAAALLAIAKARVPRGDFRRGETETLPYPDRVFQAVTGFNVFQRSARPEAALAEARRVACPGAPVVIAAWGKPEDSEVAHCLAALRPFLPASPAGPGPFALSADGALEAFARRAGLTPGRVDEVECPFEYPDRATALRGLLSAGPAVPAIRTAGKDRIREAVANAIAPYRLSSGGYRLEHSFVFMIAAA